MSNRRVIKKRVVISQENLPEELTCALKEQFPLGYGDSMIRIDKPNGDFFNAVVLETPDITYLVKVKVKIDSNPAEEFEKDTFDEQTQDQMQDASELADELSDGSDE